MRVGCLLFLFSEGLFTLIQSDPGGRLLNGFKSKESNLGQCRGTHTIIKLCQLMNNFPTVSCDYINPRSHPFFQL